MPTGLTLAVPQGFLRGHVMVFMPSGQNLAEFLITGGGWFVLVSTRPVQKLHMCIDGIEAAFREVIAGLRLVPAGGQVSCELWLYSRYGTFRHFRVSATGLVEINAYGTPLDQLNTSPAADPSGGTETTEPAGLSAALPTRPGIDPRSPIIRWLVKWNAARLAGEKGGGVENEGLKKALAAGGPAVKKKRPAGKKPEKNPAGKKPEAKPAGEKPEKTPAGPEKNSGTGTDGVPAKNREHESPAGRKRRSRQRTGRIPIYRRNQDRGSHPHLIRRLPGRIHPSPWRTRGPRRKETIRDEVNRSHFNLRLSCSGAKISEYDEKPASCSRKPAISGADRLHSLPEGPGNDRIQQRWGTNRKNHPGPWKRLQGPEGVGVIGG